MKVSRERSAENRQRVIEVAGKLFRALSATSEMVGALVLARAVDVPSLSEEIVAATAARLGEGSR